MSLSLSILIESQRDFQVSAPLCIIVPDPRGAIKKAAAAAGRLT